MEDFPFTLLLNADPAIGAGIGGVLGLVAGSYLATLLIRARHGPDAVLSNRSACDSCGRQLRWFELVPVLSYLACRGQCRTCKSPIPREHAAIEAGCGVIGAGCVFFGHPWLAPLGWLVLILAFYDFMYFWLPNRIVAALAIAAVLAPGYDDAAGYSSRVLGGAIGFLSLWSVGRIYMRLRGRQGLGGGDPKMFGALGLWTGVAALPTLLLIACMIGLVDAARRSRTSFDAVMTHLPFGAYLAGACLLLMGRRIFAV